MAEARSSELVAHDAWATSARHMAVAAVQRPDPVLSIGITNLPIEGRDRYSLTRDFMTMRSVGVMQELTRETKLRSYGARYERAAEVAQANRALALATLRRETALAWLDRHYAERVQQQLQALHEEARLQFEAAESAYRAGRGSQADVFASRAEAAQIDDRLAQAQREAAVAALQLVRWAGPSADAVLGEAPTMDTVPLRDEDFAERIAQHPEIHLMAQQEAMARAEADIARSAKRADPSVEFMYSQRGPAYVNMVSVTITLPVQWNREQRQERELAARLATVAQVQAQREEASRVRRAEAQALLRQWHANRQRLTRYDASLLPLAADRTRAALAAYRGGPGPLGAVLDARRGEIDTRIERLRLEAETARLWAQLSFLLPASPPAAGADDTHHSPLPRTAP
jgi:outer membrane protein TolC